MKAQRKVQTSIIIKVFGNIHQVNHQLFALDKYGSHDTAEYQVVISAAVQYQIYSKHLDNLFTIDNSYIFYLLIMYVYMLYPMHLMSQFTHLFYNYSKTHLQAPSSTSS